MTDVRDEQLIEDVLRVIRVRYCLTMDSDGRNLPESVEDMLAAMAADVAGAMEALARSRAASPAEQRAAEVAEACKRDRTILFQALAALEPYLDAIVCFASDMGEHEPNRLAANARHALAKVMNL